MILKTKRLVLRPFTIEDFEAVHVYAQDYDTCKYMLNLPSKTPEDTMKFLRRVEHDWSKDVITCYEFAIVLDDAVIGAVSVEDWKETGVGELGWVLNKTYQGKGYALEAASAVRDFAFDVLLYERLVAHCDARNVGSYTLMERIGMALVDDTHTRVNKDGCVAQELEYSM
ncbi:MAG: GNAT family N-acetyltransferase [Lachnospiraceae bacterium]